MSNKPVAFNVCWKCKTRYATFRSVLKPDSKDKVYQCQKCFDAGFEPDKDANSTIPIPQYTKQELKEFREHLLEAQLAAAPTHQETVIKKEGNTKVVIETPAESTLDGV